MKGMYERKVKKVRVGKDVEVKDAGEVGDAGALMGGGVRGCRGAWTLDEIYRFAEAYIRTMDKGKAWRAMRPRGVEEVVDDGTAEKMAYVVMRDARFLVAVERLGKAVALSKARLNILLGEEIERAAERGELGGASKLIDVVCKMNGYYEASKVEVKHGALDDENRERALGALREAGGEVVDAAEARSVPLLQ